MTFGPIFASELEAAGIDVINLPIGWRDDGTIVGWDSLTKEQQAVVKQVVAAHDSTKQPVPQISKAQVLLYLLSLGKTEADVDAAIATISDKQQKAVASIEWKYRGTFHYDNPTVMALAPALGIKLAALPDAFRAAAKL